MTYHHTLDLIYIINQVLPIIRLAGTHLLPYFKSYTQHKTNASVDYKEDNSPVTEADKITEQWIRKELRMQFPKYGILGEEFGDDTAHTEFSWTIDPIDGTKTFITGVPLFTTLLSLIHTETRTPLLGIISAPVTQEIIHAGIGTGTWYNGMKVNVQDCNDISHATMLSYDWCKVYAQHPSLLDLCMQAGMTRTWADGFAYLLLGSGKAHAIVDLDMSLWDIAPAYPIITEAGGLMTTFDHKPIDWRQKKIDIITASSSYMLDKIHKIL